MKTLIATALIVGISSPAMATSITDGHLKLSFTTENSVSIIELTGQIVDGDSDSFSRLAEHIKTGDVIVALRSPGGTLVEGLAIGEMVKTRKYMTVANGLCGSACAYIWIAGDKRGMTRGSQVIFHAPFMKDDNEHADGAAGVLVGQYMAEIGIDIKTSMAISGHGPNDYYVISAAAVNPIIPFIVVGEEPQSKQQKPPSVAQQQPQQRVPSPSQQQTTITRPTALAMKCYPAKGSPYVVIYVNGKAAVIGKSGKPHEYPVHDVNDNQEKQVFYVSVKDSNQERTLYFAFDYSHLGRDVSDIRVMAPKSYDVKDKCAMDWGNTK